MHLSCSKKLTSSSILGTKIRDKDKHLVISNCRGIFCRYIRESLTFFYITEKKYTLKFYPKMLFCMNDSERKVMRVSIFGCLNLSKIIVTFYFILVINYSKNGLINKFYHVSSLYLHHFYNKYKENILD